MRLLRHLEMWLAAAIITAAAAEESCTSFTRVGAATLATPPRVRGRPALPDTHHAWMPDAVRAPGPDFPAVFRYAAPEGEGGGDAAAAGAALRRLVDGGAHGALVAKGLPVGRDPAAFSALMAATGLPLRRYVGGVTSRSEVAPYVGVISEERADLSMEPHQDNPYWASPPTHLAIFVARPPASGGQALLSDARAVLRTLNATRPALVARLADSGVRYEKYYPPGAAADGGITTWNDAFGADRAAAEVALADLLGGFEWLEDGGLRTWEVAPAIRDASPGEEPTFFAMMTAMHCSVFDDHPDYLELNRSPTDAPCAMRGRMPYHTRFGDGAEFAVEDVRAARRAQWAHAVSFDYEAGDVLIVDNYRTMHGRFSFEPPRDLYITMVG